MFHFQVKIAARELEKVIAGLTMRVAHHPDEVSFDFSITFNLHPLYKTAYFNHHFQVEILKEACERDLASALNAIKLKPLGVFVQVGRALLLFLSAFCLSLFCTSTLQASTLGSLEALLEFLKQSKIP